MLKALRQVEEAVARACSPQRYPTPGPAFSDASLREFSRDLVAAHAADERRLDPAHRPSWDILLLEARRLTAALRPLLDIRFVPFEAYGGPEELRADVLGNHRLEVSTLHCEHPLWSPEDNCEFRVAHDILGHVLRLHPFSLVGEYLAFHEHMGRTDPRARQALFTELCVYASIRYTTGAYPDTQRAIAFPTQLADYERRFIGETTGSLSGSWGTWR